jgi:hypothetical protein
VQATYDVWNNDAPIINIKNGSVVGYKYFTFLAENKTRLDVWLTPRGRDVTIDIMMNTPWADGTNNPGVKIGELRISASDVQVKTKFSVSVPSLSAEIGKRAIFFVFGAPSAGTAEVCQLNGLGFSCEGNEISAPAPVPTVSIFANGAPLTMPAQPANSTNANGIYEFTVYDITYSHTGATAPIVTASASDSSIGISVMQAKSTAGIAIVKFSRGGFLNKYYYIRFQRSGVTSETGYPPFIGAVIGRSGVSAAKAVFSINNMTETAIDAICLLAVYDAGGRLVAVKQDNISAGRKTASICEITESIAGGAVKAFIWDANTFIPLCEEAILTQIQTG